MWVFVIKKYAVIIGIIWGAVDAVDSYKALWNVRIEFSAEKSKNNCYFREDLSLISPPRK